MLRSGDAWWGQVGSGVRFAQAGYGQVESVAVRSEVWSAAVGNGVVRHALVLFGSARCASVGSGMVGGGAWWRKSRYGVNAVWSEVWYSDVSLGMAW